MVPREQLRLVRKVIDGNRSTYIRTEADELYCVSLGKEVPKNNRYSWGEQSDRATVLVRNACGRRLVVVMVQADDTTSTSTQDERRPHAQMLVPGDVFPFRLDKEAGTLRLIVCTLDGISDTTAKNSDSSFSPYPDSSTTSESSAPQSDTDGGCRDVKILRLWDSMMAYGGRDIGVLPAFSRGYWVQSMIVRNENQANLADLAMSMDREFAQAVTPLRLMTTIGKEPDRKKHPTLRSIASRLTRSK